MDGLLSLPAGGLEANETIRHAAIREAEEEVGVAVDPFSLRHFHVLHALTHGQDWIGHFFVASKWTGEPALREPTKHGDLSWELIDDLPGDVIPYVRQALTAFRCANAYSDFGWAIGQT